MILINLIALLLDTVNCKSIKRFYEKKMVERKMERDQERKKNGRRMVHIKGRSNVPANVINDGRNG